MATAEVIGVPALIRKLNALDAKTGAKVLRQATMAAAKPVVDEAKIRIPVGDTVHRTYKGNLVGPGFAKRSIKRVSKIIGGTVHVMIGVKREAFYATQFVELGVEHAAAKPWLVPAFENNKDKIEARLIEVLRRKILQVAKQ